MFNKQKRYFRKKLDGVQKMVWDLEFKKAKTQSIREEIRVEYDNMRSKLATLENQITIQKEKPTMEAGDIARLDDQKVLLDKDIERLLGQMKGLDLEVSGSKSTAEFPDGVQGINQQIDALRELQIMLNAYIKEI
mgnify:CR=1 FL=1